MNENSFEMFSFLVISMRYDPKTVPNFPTKLEGAHLSDEAQRRSEGPGSCMYKNNLKRNMRETQLVAPLLFLHLLFQVGNTAVRIPLHHRQKSTQKKQLWGEKDVTCDKALCP